MRVVTKPSDRPRAGAAPPPEPPEPEGPKGLRAPRPPPHPRGEPRPPAGAAVAVVAEGLRRRAARSERLVVAEPPAQADAEHLVARAHPHAPELVHGLGGEQRAAAGGQRAVHPRERPGAERAV